MASLVVGRHDAEQYTVVKYFLWSGTSATKCHHHSEGLNSTCCHKFPKERRMDKTHVRSLEEDIIYHSYLKRVTKKKKRKRKP